MTVRSAGCEAAITRCSAPLLNPTLSRGIARLASTEANTSKPKATLAAAPVPVSVTQAARSRSHSVLIRASARNCAAGSGLRRTDRAAAATGTAAVTRARATAGPSGSITRAHGTGAVESAVRVIAGTINWARPIPASRPAAAAGRLSAHCSRHS